eukprot:14985-Hanusia_phi.AAC.1
MIRRAGRSSPAPGVPYGPAPQPPPGRGPVRYGHGRRPGRVRLPGGAGSPVRPSPGRTVPGHAMIGPRAARPRPGCDAIMNCPYAGRPPVRPRRRPRDRAAARPGAAVTPGVRRVTAA